MHHILVFYKYKFINVDLVAQFVFQTVLDLPCLAIAVQAEQHPTHMINDSDTVTARQIDSGRIIKLF